MDTWKLNILSVVMQTSALFIDSGLLLETRRMCQSRNLVSGQGLLGKWVNTFGRFGSGQTHSLTPLLNVMNARR